MTNTKKSYKPNVIIIMICLLIIAGMVDYLRIYARDFHYCHSGDKIDSLVVNSTWYISCGQPEEYTIQKVIENSSIIKKKIVTQEGNSHIESFPLNWTDEDKYKSLGEVFIVLIIVALLVIIINLMGIMEKRWGILR
jgi:hypothetical protein